MWSTSPNPYSVCTTSRSRNTSQLHPMIQLCCCAVLPGWSNSPAFPTWTSSATILRIGCCSRWFLHKLWPIPLFFLSWAVGVRHWLTGIAFGNIFHPYWVPKWPRWVLFRVFIPPPRHDSSNTVPQNVKKMCSVVQNRMRINHEIGNHRVSLEMYALFESC